ncbi:MAG: tetratricopeptide repeat protein, partial [Bacteroidia bacterium]
MSYVYHTTCILLLLLFSLVLKGGTPPPQDTAGVLKELSKGVDSIKKGNYPFALKTAWRNIPWLVKADQKNILAKCYRMAGSAHERLAAHDSAIIYYRKALDLFASINNKKQVAQCHHNIAAVMYARGDYEKSLGEYVEAIKIREDIKDTIGLAWSQNNIGNIYWYQKAYDDALDHYIKAREMFTLKNYNEGVGLTTGNMALIYETKGDTLKALESYKAAVKANQEAENEIAVAGVLCNLGSFYFRNKQYKEATACYNRALEINERLQNYYGLSLTYSGMASLCEIKNDLDCSEKWLLKALANNNKSGDRQSNIGTYRNLSSVYFTSSS